MIITRTPFRVSFFGGGTDYPTWVSEHGGAVLSTTIDKYCYISCRRLPPFFEHKHRIVYSKIESVKSVDEIEHPSVRACLNWMKPTSGLEIHHDGDLPAKSGLGSSSSFTVGLLHALKGLAGGRYSDEHLAQEAIYIEQKVIGESVGSQDQIAAAYGGLNKVVFNRDGSFVVNPFCLSLERKNELQDHLMLFFTGLSRFASEVAATKIKNFKNREKELKIIRSMVDEGCKVLGDSGEPILNFGQLLDTAWHYKRELSDAISNPLIDEMYEAAKDAGAVGGKLLGAGGGGFLLIFSPPNRQKAIIEKLKNLIYVPLKFEEGGSRVIFYQPSRLHGHE